MTELTPITTIRKSAEEEVRVALNTSPTFTLVDMRIFAFFRRKQDMGATGRGIAIRVERLPELIGALQAAYDRARELGLVKPEVRR